MLSSLTSPEPHERTLLLICRSREAGDSGQGYVRGFMRLYYIGHKKSVFSCVIYITYRFRGRVHRTKRLWARGDSARRSAWDGGLTLGPSPGGRGRNGHRLPRLSPASASGVTASVSTITTGTASGYSLERGRSRPQWWRGGHAIRGQTEYPLRQRRIFV